jgi:hypothetical protein
MLYPLPERLMARLYSDYGDNPTGGTDFFWERSPVAGGTVNIFFPWLTEKAARKRPR